MKEIDSIDAAWTFYKIKIACCVDKRSPFMSTAADYICPTLFLFILHRVCYIPPHTCTPTFINNAELQVKVRCIIAENAMRHIPPLKCYSVFSKAWRMLCKQASCLWCTHHMGDTVNLTDHKEELFCGLTEMPKFSRREITSMGRCLLQLCYRRRADCYPEA